MSSFLRYPKNGRNPEWKECFFFSDLRTMLARATDMNLDIIDFVIPFRPMKVVVLLV